jgi:predicted nucleic acid-binding protein
VIILDTNVLSELMTPAPAPKVVSWVANQRSLDTVFVSTITVAEILYGIALLPAGKRRDKLEFEAEAMFSEDFAGRILSFEEESARAFSRIASRQRKRGAHMADFDAQIAAIAQVHGAALATRNTDDFKGCGVRLLNPWVD